MTTFNFNFTEEQLVKILPTNKQIHDWFVALSNNLPAHHIDTVARVAAFLAQCGHESMDFTALHENLNYRAASLIATWPTRFNATNAPLYEKQPEKIANMVYSKRMGNGDEASGDGWKYRGRGPIQITGKNNYTACSLALFKDDRLVKNPELVELDKDVAVKSACWYWDITDLNHLADTSDITSITKKINGGTIGIADRKDRFNKAVAILKG